MNIIHWSPLFSSLLPRFAGWRLNAGAWRLMLSADAQRTAVKFLVPHRCVAGPVCSGCINGAGIIPPHVCLFPHSLAGNFELYAPHGFPTRAVHPPLQTFEIR